MDHQRFKSNLQKIIGSRTMERPFVCDGFPMECDIFIVGINPATSLKKDYWSFWQDDRFDRDKWMQQYEEERKDKHFKISPTRKKINYLVEQVFREYKCLETNVYTAATPNIAVLKEEQKKTDVFSFLVRCIQPKAMFIHGKDPADFIKHELGARFLSKTPLTINYELNNTISAFEYEWTYGKMVVCATKHLRLIKQEEMIHTAQRLIASLKQLDA